MRRDASGLTTCTRALASKFTPRYPFSYFSEVPFILEKSGGRHIHVGPLEPSQLRQIHEGIAARGLPQEKFVHVRQVRCLWQHLVDCEVGMYISSFPVFGGRALLEALGSGTPVLAHRQSFSSCFSDIEMLYPGCLEWRTRDDLHRAIASADTALLRRHAQTGRDWYEQQYSMDTFIRCLGTVVEGNADVKPFQPARSDPDPMAPFLAIGALMDAASNKLGISTILEEHGLADRAAACTEEIMQLDKIVAGAYHQAGLRKLAAKQHDPAIALLSRASEIDPAEPLYLNSLACAVSEAGNLAVAQQYLERALALAPDFAQAKENLTVVMQRRARAPG